MKNRAKTEAKPRTYDKLNLKSNTEKTSRGKRAVEVN